MGQIELWTRKSALLTWTEWTMNKKECITYRDRDSCGIYFGGFREKIKPESEQLNEKHNLPLHIFAFAKNITPE